MPIEEILTLKGDKDPRVLPNLSAQFRVGATSNRAGTATGTPGLQLPNIWISGWKSHTDLDKLVGESSGESNK